jgi:N6-adenosine-specific RNA methylase IME4
MFYGNTDTLEIHPLADLYPHMPEDEFLALKADILSQGLLDPITLHENKIIDGRHRYRACQELDITPQFTTFAGSDPIAFVISKNQHRRHLTSSQRAMIATEVEAEYAKLAKERMSIGGKSHDGTGKTKEGTQFFGYLEKGESAKQAAKQLNTNHQYVSDAKRLKAEAPEIAEKVKQGEINIPEAKELAKEAPETRDAILQDAKDKDVPLKEAASIHKLLKHAPQQFIDFCLRMQLKEAWRIDLMREWYDNNHNDTSKFSHVEFAGILQIPNGQDYDIRTASIRELKQAEKEWAKLVRKLEMDAAQMEKRAAILHTPETVFSVVYADPAWQYSNSGLNGSAEKHYSTMPTPQICTLLKDNHIKVQDNAVLFLWTTNSHIPDALEVIKAWGFEYKANFVWVKDMAAYGKLAFYNRGQHELLFLATRGKFTPFHDLEELPTSIIQARKGAHSAKPDEVRDLIESLYPGQRYIELFARQHPPRKGWTFWGNEEKERVHA